MNKASNKSQATIVDIAKETNYSIATVSRALNNFSNVRPKVKQKITSTAAKLHYVPNIAARSLVQGKSKIIGLVLPDSSLIYSKFTKLFSNILESKGYFVLSHSAENNAKRQHFIIDLLQRQQVDALAINPVPGEYEAIKKIVDAQIPVVIFNRFIREFAISSIDFDFRPGVREAIDILVAKGRRYFYQFVRQDIYSGKERRNTFYFHLNKHGIRYQKSHTLSVNDDFESAYEQMKHLIESKKKVDVVLCSSDFTALGVIRCCFDHQIKVPEDVSIVGAYNNILSKFVHPKISSINADFGLLAEKVADLLLKKLSLEQKELIEHQSIKTTFLERETT